MYQVSSNYTQQFGQMFTGLFPYMSIVTLNLDLWNWKSVEFIPHNMVNMFAKYDEDLLSTLVFTLFTRSGVIHKVIAPTNTKSWMEPQQHRCINSLSNRVKKQLQYN